MGRDRGTVGSETQRRLPVGSTSWASSPVLKSDEGQRLTLTSQEA